MLHRIRSSEFVQHVGSLAVGTLIGQALTVAVSPLVARLYTPSEIAASALFTALLLALAPAVCGRFEIALLVARDDGESEGLLALSMWTALGVSGALAILLVCFFQQIAGFLNAGSLGRFLMLSPICLFLLAIVKALQHCANRDKKYREISHSNVSQAACVAVVSLSLGLLGSGMVGLVLATLIGNIAAVTYLCVRYRELISNTRWRMTAQLWRLALRYREYPIVNASTSLLDGVSLALPIFFLTKYFPADVVGYFAMITRVASAPLAFIAGAVSQINLRKVAELVNTGRPVRPYLYKVTAFLTAIVIVPTITFMVFGSEIFAFGFGEPWRAAGELLFILMPSLALRFIVSTLSGTLLATGHVRLVGAWQIAFFSITSLTLTMVAPRASVREMFITMMTLDIVLYLAYYACICYGASAPRKVR